MHIVIVMSGRTSNQINNLRALFEPSKDPSSPPSRGRSPAGLASLTDENSRPCSKVRTSFVAVDRIGPMAPSIDLQKPDNGSKVGLGEDAVSESKLALSGTASKFSSMNGSSALPEPLDARIGDKDIEEGKEAVDAAHEAKSANAANKTTPSGQNAETPVRTSFAGAKDCLVNGQTSEPKNEDGKSGISSLPTQDQDLGKVLKGASFDEEEQNTSQNSGERGSHLAENSSPPKTQTEPIVSELANGQSNEQPTPKPTLTEPDPVSSRSLADTIGETPPADPTSAAATSPTTSKKSSKTPNSPNVPNQQPSSKIISPRQPISGKAPGQAAKHAQKAPIPKSSRVSAVSKGSSAITLKPRQQGNSSTGTKQATKDGPASPPVKIRPKSPTRPVRLPATVTAPTASSAAKSGEAALSSPPRRAGATNGVKPSTSNRDRPTRNSREAAAASRSTALKTSRPSLPAASTSGQKTKTQTSTVSAKAPEGSFLTRMMRPTQSSASKVHEKVEHASPPSKSHSVKPKRKSGGTDEREQRAEAVPASSLQKDRDQAAPPPAERAGEMVPKAEGEGVTADPTT